MAYIDLTFAGIYTAPTGNEVALNFLGDINATGTADIVASSSLSVALISFADISAISSLTATGLTNTNTAVLNGVASLTATGLTNTNTAVLNGVASLTATGLTNTNTAALNGVSSLTANFKNNADISATSSLTATGLTNTNTATLNGVASLTATANLYNQAYISAVSSLTATGLTNTNTAALNSIASLTAINSPNLEAHINAVSVLQATGTVPVEPSTFTVGTDINCLSLNTANAITFNNIADIRTISITEARYNYANYIAVSHVSAIGTLSNHLGNIESISKVNIYYTQPLPDPIWTDVKGTYEIRYN